jgi:hypothetical protein
MRRRPAWATFTPPAKTTIRQLLEERAKAMAATAAIGTEQISRSGSSDAGAVVTKVAGATVVEGKFAVIRGLSDRYVTTTLNGGEIPSADPYRRAAVRSFIRWPARASSCPRHCCGSVAVFRAADNSASRFASRVSNSHADQDLPGRASLAAAASFAGGAMASVFVAKAICWLDETVTLWLMTELTR